MDEKANGVYRDGQLCSIDIFEMIEAVKTQQVEIVITMEPDRTEITVQPWRPYRMACPYAGEVAHEESDV